MTLRLSESHGTADLATMISTTHNRTGTAMSSSMQSESMPITPDVSPPARRHSKSVPSTPSHRPNTNGIERESPSVSRLQNDSSPMSHQTDSSQTPPVARRPVGGCRFETGMAKARRRVPYSEGPEKLAPEPAKMKKELNRDHEEVLTRDIQDLYNRLLPTAESESRRSRLIEKLKKILRGRWPDCSINVKVFGSTGNNLGTCDSDIYICITTDCK